MIDDPFRLIGIREVYLAPEMESRLQPRPELGRLSDYVLPSPVANRALLRGEAVVYSAGPVYRNVTATYEARARTAVAELPRRIDCGNRAFADYLGPEWYSADAGVRWMPAKATVRMAAPKAGEHLYISGYRAQQAGSDYPVLLTVAANGKPLGSQTIAAGATQFSLEFPVASSGDGLNISLQVDRTFRPPNDGRDLGLAFGVLELR
jgi:hypothetical protein